jgi:tRNA 2-thiouridine synthesizing protein A
MTVHTLNARGLRCPQPIIKVTSMVPAIDQGDVLDVTADCETFEDDMRKWCARWSRTLLAVTHAGQDVTCQIQF